MKAPESPAKTPKSIEQKLDEAELEAAFALRRALKQEKRKEEARLKREEVGLGVYVWVFERERERERGARQDGGGGCMRISLCM